MSLIGDLRVLYNMALRPVRGENHAERMNNFYSGQAADYDDFRRRLLQGRERLWQKMLADVPYQDTVWMDMGGGTGSNLHFFGPAIERLGKVYVVDLAGSLLEVADRRIHESGWKNIETAEADATKYVPKEGSVDAVTFSYSLTMIPDWFAAIDHAWNVLRPGGRIGVVDFYVSRKYPAAEHRKHSWAKRSFWPQWFAYDNVFPSPDHVPYLHRKFEPLFFEEHLTRIPWFPNPFFKMPYYIFIGRKQY
ncbi:MAG: class I SAM-dependent methyltransferase [Planctomycetaceae bacterium]|jgi:S-adenosylmethionine-diacylgycerolhomoserine-N-methlytransferase|nr:class I SAM-dependent methyltransferase [Planctomycetaceae bacterium]